MRLLRFLSILSAASAGLALAAPTVHGQLASRCADDSPERRGGFGCTILGRKPLPAMTGPLFWHIDRFATADSAPSAGPSSIVFDAANVTWLATVEADTAHHHGGRHVTTVGPLELPDVPSLGMLVQAASFPPGVYSTVHHHSGPEAVYVIEGQACYQMEDRVFRLTAGETGTIPGQRLHRAVMLGTTRRYVFAVILHDATQPPTITHDGPEPALASCQ